jgi:hypothetical protein
MAAPDLSTAEAILRELWELRASKAQLDADDHRARQRAAWKAARKLLGIKAPAAAAKGEDDPA